MCVDPCAVGSTTDPPMDSHMSISKARIKFSQIFEFWNKTKDTKMLSTLFLKSSFHQIPFKDYEFP